MPIIEKGINPHTRDATTIKFGGKDNCILQTTSNADYNIEKCLISNIMHVKKFKFKLIFGDNCYTFGRRSLIIGVIRLQNLLPFRLERIKVDKKVSL